MKVLVTGGCGFIGSHLVESLLRIGPEIAIIDDFSTGNEDNLRSALELGPFTLHKMDIGSPRAAEVVRTFEPEIMVMLAAQTSVSVSMRDPLLDARSNLVGLVNLMQAAVGSGVRKVVFASSGGTIYGQAPSDSLPLREGALGDPVSFYGLTKHLGHHYLRVYRQQYGTEYVALALGNVYGPRQDPSGESGVLSIFADRLLRGEECVINGDGRATRDFVFVSDVVSAVIAAMTRGQGLINIGTGVETSVLTTLHTLAGHIGVTPRFRHGPPLGGEVRRICLSPALAARDLGWKPEVSFTEGSSALVSHLRQMVR